MEPRAPGVFACASWGEVGPRVAIGAEKTLSTRFILPGCRTSSPFSEAMAKREQETGVEAKAAAKRVGPGCPRSRGWSGLLGPNIGVTEVVTMQGLALHSPLADASAKTVRDVG